MTIVSHLQVDNYRSLYDFKIDLQPLTVLIGRNDAGKSNVLKAIRLLLDDAATAQVDRYDWNRAAPKKRYPRQLMIEGTLAGENPMTLRRRITFYSEAPATSEFEVADGSGWRTPTETEKARIPAGYYLRPRTGALQESFDPSKENNIFTLIRDWMPPALQDEKQLHKLMRNYAPDETNLSAYVRFFQDEVLGPLKLAFPADLQLQRYLNPDFRTPTDRGRLFVRELTHADAKEALIKLPLDHHGTGLISVVAIVLSVAVLGEYHRQALSGKPFLVAIEEPEVHLHAHAQRTLLEYFRWLSKQHQVLVATHSAILVDRAEPNNVIVLRRATQKDEKESSKAAR